MTTYTPGPWQVHNNIGRKSETGVIADGAPCIIAIMGNQKEWPVEAEANARLIAAAPELLESLKSALIELQAFEGAIIKDAISGEYVNPDPLVINQARAAIQKAEGE